MVVSWENKFVMVPVSVDVKKLSGACMTVDSALRCSSDPEPFVIKIVDVKAPAKTPISCKALKREKMTM